MGDILHRGSHVRVRRKRNSADRQATAKKAVRAGRVMQPRSFSMHDEFDGAKVAALRHMLLDLGLSDDKAGDLIGATQEAVIQRASAIGRAEVGNAPTLLHALAEAAEQTVAAWASISDAYPAVMIEIQGRLRANSSRGRSRRERGLPKNYRREVADLIPMLGLSLLSLAAAAKEVAEDLAAASKIRHSQDYVCVDKIAREWLAIVGKRPTFSYNKDTVLNHTDDAGGHEKTAFQRFLAAAVPEPAIGDDVVRNIVAALRAEIGAKSVESPPDVTTG